MASAAVTRALLLQVGEWARMAAALGARAPAPDPAWRDMREQWRLLNAACQWLWVADAAIRAAQRAEPVPAADVWLLHAIPAAGLPPRRLPAAAETITGLCLGATASAERIRHATRVAVPDPVWSPALTAGSLRQTAACATVISHHCDLLLQTLAARAAQQGDERLSGRLLACAHAAGDARGFWKRSARHWYSIVTDTRDATTPTAGEMADLALWTGRLAYSDPAWTLALGPSQEIRPAEDLAPGLADVPRVVAAVHQACVTLEQVAAANHAQISVAAGVGRLLVPTRSLPECDDIPHPFAPAPPDRISRLQAAYAAAGQASARATAAVAEAAADVRAPSHVLTLARAAAHSGATTAAAATDGWQPVRLAADESRGLPGPVEGILHDLDVTRPDLLSRAAAIDRASELLILEAAQAAVPARPARDAITRNKSAAVTELINHALATGDGRAVTVLRPPPPPAPRPPGSISPRATSRPATSAGHHPQPAPGFEAEP